MSKPLVALVFFLVSETLTLRIPSVASASRRRTGLGLKSKPLVALVFFRQRDADATNPQRSVGVLADENCLDKNVQATCGVGVFSSARR